MLQLVRRLKKRGFATTMACGWSAADHRAGRFAPMVHPSENSVQMSQVLIHRRGAEDAEKTDLSA